MSDYTVLGLFIVLITSVLPFVIGIVFLYWVYQIKNNSAIQTKQNQKIIDLLEQSKGQ